MRSCAFPTRAAPDLDHGAGRQGRRSSRGARSTITGPRTSSASPDGSTTVRRRSGRTATSARTAWRPRKGRAAVWVVDPRTGEHRIFASGLRNPNGLAFEPGQRRAVDGRQRARRARQRPRARLHDGAARRRVSTAGRTATTARTSTSASSRRSPDLVASAIKPDYALGPHTASLGLASAQGARLGARIRQRHVRRASTDRGTASRAAATR